MQKEKKYQDRPDRTNTILLWQDRRENKKQGINYTEFSREIRDVWRG